MSKKTVRDIDLKDKKVFVRCDFNVPLDDDGNITDNRRIVGALPTIKYLLENNCKIILFILLAVKNLYKQTIGRFLKFCEHTSGHSYFALRFILISRWRDI